MRSLLDGPRAAAPDRPLIHRESLIGDQRPRILWVPPGATSSAAAEVVELAASVGLVLDDWQEFTLDQGLGETDAGLWVALEVAELVSRQNGKDGTLEALELAALYLFGTKLALHSTHRFKTTLEHFRRLVARITNYDDLRRRVKRINYTHGEESVELLGGQRLEFMARSTSSGRGFSGELLILNEAQILTDASMEAVMPTLSARPFGTTQVWYMLTAPDPEKVGPCEVAARLRRRARKGGDPGLVYLEWSADPHDEQCDRDCREHDEISDPRTWAKANPALGIRIDPRTVEREMASMSLDGFLRERLGVGRWPAESGGWAVISEDQWTGLEDSGSEVAGVLAFGVGVLADASAAAIAVVGARQDGNLHLEIVEHRPQASWVPARLKELADQHRPCGVALDGNGASAVLLPALAVGGFTQVAPAAPQPNSGHALLRLYPREAAQAAGMLYEAATDAKTVRHLGQPELQVAVAGAVKRALSGSWGWGRPDTSVDISPLQAVTNALYGYANRSHLRHDAGEKDYFWDPFAGEQTD